MCPELAEKYLNFKIYCKIERKINKFSTNFYSRVSKKCQVFDTRPRQSETLESEELKIS